MYIFVQRSINVLVKFLMNLNVHGSLNLFFMLLVLAFGVFQQGLRINMYTKDLNMPFKYDLQLTQ